jgi:hypothetical protein
MAARQGKEHGMTVDRPTTLPPASAESLLRLMLRPEDRDSISGDLLEEYRQSIVPARGAKANRWYILQVGWYVLRATWTWGVLVAAICIWRYLLDTLAPIHYTRGVIALRSAVMSWALMAVFSGCGAWHAWRTRHLRAGMLLTLIAATIGGYLGMAGTLVCLAVSHGPETLAAIEGSGGLFEGFPGAPVLLLIVAFVASTPGAIAGRIAGTVYDWSRAKTKSA